MFRTVSIGGVALALAFGPAIAQATPAHEAPEGATHGAGVEQRSETGTDHAGGSGAKGGGEGGAGSAAGEARKTEGQSHESEGDSHSSEAGSHSSAGSSHGAEGDSHGSEGRHHGEGKADGKHGQSGKDHGEGRGAPAKCREHEAAYVAAGTLVSDTLTKSEEGRDRYNGQVVIEVARTNEHARAARGETETYTLADVAVRGPLSVEALAAGDWVKVIGKTAVMEPKCETPTATPTIDIHRLVIHGPKHMQPVGATEGGATK